MNWVAILGWAGLLIAVLPVLVFTRAISKRAKTARAHAASYELASVGSGLVGILVGNLFVAKAFIDIQSIGGLGIPDWTAECVAALCGVISASVGPALCYLSLWLRTARDQDYDDQLKNKKSRVAHVRQHRKRDDDFAE